jgi:hypothetical protein
MSKNKPARIYNARPDTIDFRDTMYEPTLVEVPTRIALENYKKRKVPILDQGQEGACTGFGLATVANFLLRTRKIIPDNKNVSPRMFYEMAKRYDEWPGEDYEGSSARGAMKGWHKHGICTTDIWPYSFKKPDQKLTNERIFDAARRPLGAYLRVNHRDLVAMHTAITEVGVLYATATVHAGWDNITSNGIIPIMDKVLGGHAFAIVAYDERGFWIQNSWGPKWGAGGFGLVTYTDWLKNGTDVWVARLGVPVSLETLSTKSKPKYAGRVLPTGLSYGDLRPHVISIGNDGELKPNGNYGTTDADLDEIINVDFPRITNNWAKKRILIYAHGGLVDESSALQRIADYRQPLLEREIYPLAFIWHSDYWTTLTNMLDDAQRRRRPEGILDKTKDFMLDRLDDALEPLARQLTGKAEWDEMKENAILATRSPTGGARKLLARIKTMLVADKGIEVHVIGHSAGCIFHAPLVQLLATNGTITSGPMKGEKGLALTVNTCTLWAPACTIKLFKETYLPSINGGGIKKFALFTLTDQFEQDDNCAKIYNKSLLYLVSNAFEDKPRIPLPVIGRDGFPILGMEKFISKDTQLKKLFGKSSNVELVLSPNTSSSDPKNYATARHHGDFDDDKATVTATMNRILRKATETADFVFPRSASSLRGRRRMLR